MIFKKKMIGHRQYVKHVHAKNTNSIFVFASKGENSSPLKKKKRFLRNSVNSYLHVSSHSIL